MGISQGSIISSLLCSIYYAKMESEYLHGYVKETIHQHNTVQEQEYMGTDWLMNRQHDDFLLITSDLNRAQYFCRALLKGEYTN